MNEDPDPDPEPEPAIQSHAARTSRSPADPNVDVDLFAREAGQASRQLRAVPAERIAERKQLEEKINHEFESLEETFCETFQSVGRFRGVHPSDVDDIRQRFALGFSRKIRHFHEGSFQVWLQRCAENAIKDHYRSQNRQPKAMEPSSFLELESDGRAITPSFTEHAENGLRNVDRDALQQNVNQWLDGSGPPHPTWRHFFVVASGLDFCLPESQRPRSEPNDWPTHDTIWHANRCVIEMTEQSFVDQAASDAVTLEEQEREFDRRLKAKRSTAAQNLNRHYWRFLQFPEIWNWVLRFVPPLESDEDRVPDESALRLLLYFGGWVALDSPLVWQRWLDTHGLENTINRNFIRCLVPSAGFDSSQTGTASLHPRWTQLIDQWFASANPKPLIEPTRDATEVFPLLQHVSRLGHLKDLPVPFRSEVIDAPAF